jgi:hypothetical protein
MSYEEILTRLIDLAFARHTRKCQKAIEAAR